MVHDTPEHNGVAKCMYLTVLCKEIKKLKDILAPCCIKMTIHLIAVIQYVHL